MSNINATMVKELREKTGAGIMESGRLVADRPLAAGYPQRLGHGGVFLLVGRIDMGVAIDDPHQDLARSSGTGPESVTP